ncbi:MAG: TraB/VirB10 family protein [Nitrospiraceae bacterium]|nr:TraB/VirB10 family protein [Nitrospiraceae bacterium]
MEALKKKWAELTPKKKKKAVLLAIVIMVLFLAMVTYRPKKEAKTAAQVASSSKTISLDSGMLKKSEYMDVQKQLSNFKNEIVKLKAQKAAVANGTAAPVEKSEKPARVQPPIPKYIPSLSVPRASSYPRGYPPLPEEEIKKPALTPTPQIIGGIEVVEGPPGKRAPQETGEAKKKQSESVYLPPSFMEATLLTGLDAPTAEGAKGEPVPVLLRIKAPAVLPNRVKANLKGCFVIAEGYGSLADERAHLRLVTLSCIARDGGAVIDQPVKGFVVDDDGKIGLRGRVVSKMGSALARSFIAGFFGGIGSATQVAAQTTSISALGYTQTVQPSKILEAGVGGGIAQGANHLEQFYLSLAKQSMPVVEVGATRDVTLVISEGVSLQIKNFCNQMGDNKCGN